MLNTIGYEGAELSDFVSTLRETGVKVLIDVRDRAQSRKKGFSKTALSSALNDADIEYIHLRVLGDPKEGREAARAGNWNKFHDIYTGVLATDAAKDAIDIIQQISAKKQTCLLCYERDHKTCHRKYISDTLDARTGVKTRHLGVRKYAAAA